MGYGGFGDMGVEKVKMEFGLFGIGFNIKKMVGKMRKGGVLCYLRGYLRDIRGYKLFIRVFFVEKEKVVVDGYKKVEGVFSYLYWEF